MDTPRSIGLRFGLALALIAVLSLPAAPPGFAISTPTVTLAGTVLRGLSKLTPTGPTDSATPVTLGVGIAHSNDAQEEAYLESIYTPGDPLYEQYLDPVAYQQRFGVPQSSLDAVSGWLRSGGLTVTTVPSATDYALASGTAGQVAQLLSISFSNFVVNGVSHYAATVDPSVPATLGIETIAGLDNIQGPQLIPHSTSTSAQVPPATSVPPQIGLTTPQVLWDIYDQPASNKGEGQSMAIFGWGVTDGVADDLRRFELEYSFPATQVTISHFGSETAVTDTIGAGEWRLDTQAATGMAPNTTGVKLYFGKAGTDPDLIAAYKAWVNDRSGPLQGQLVVQRPRGGACHRLVHGRTWQPQWCAGLRQPEPGPVRAGTAAGRD